MFHTPFVPSYLRCFVILCLIYSANASSGLGWKCDVWQKLDILIRDDYYIKKRGNQGLFGIFNVMIKK